MNRSSVVRWLGIGAAAVVVVAAGTAAFLSLQTPFQSPSSQETTACTPQPCLDVRGYVLWVGDMKIEGGLVSMQLTFRNSSSSTHADPGDLRLVDSQNHTDVAVYDAPGCDRWPRTDFNHGAEFGPVPECFRPATTAPPLTLRWSPDMGFFCCQADLTLAAAGD